MRKSTEIQTEYDELKRPGKPTLDKKTDDAYKEAIKRTKLEDQARELQEFEVLVDDIMRGRNTIIQNRYL